MNQKLLKMVDSTKRNSLRNCLQFILRIFEEKYLKFDFIKKGYFPVIFTNIPERGVLKDV